MGQRLLSSQTQLVYSQVIHYSLKCRAFQLKNRVSALADRTFPDRHVRSSKYLCARMLFSVYANYFIIGLHQRGSWSTRLFVYRLSRLG